MKASGTRRTGARITPVAVDFATTDGTAISTNDYRGTNGTMAFPPNIGFRTLSIPIVNDTLVMSVRNLGYSRNAGEFVRKYFNEIGSAGGHRAMAKAVVPLRNFKEKFGNLQADEYTEKVLSLALEFLHEHQPTERKLVKA